MEKDARVLEIEVEEVARIERDRDEKIRTIRNSGHRQLERLLKGKKAGSKVLDDTTGEVLLDRGDAYNTASLSRIAFEMYEKLTVDGGGDSEEKIWALVDRVREKEDQIQEKSALKI